MNTEKSWNGFRREDFVFEGKDAVIVFPKKETETKHWVLKTEYFGAFPDLEIELLKKGYHLVFITNMNRWGIQNDLHIKKRFLDFVIEKLDLEPKGVAVGMSCGGLFGIKFAGMFPERISVLYLDAPVVNILSMLGMGELKPTEELVEEIYEALSMNKSEIISYREHPLDYLQILLKDRIPVCLVYGDCDSIVNYKENAEIVMKTYHGSNVPFLRILKEGGDHHPHALQGMSLSEKERIIEFILTFDRYYQNP